MSQQNRETATQKTACEAFYLCVLKKNNQKNS